MYLPDINLHRTSTLAEACELLERLGPDARLLAGGTDLLVDLKTKRVTAGHLVSIAGIDALRGLSFRDGRLHIGALTTPNQLGADRVVAGRFASMLDTVRDMASPQIRNVATVGGNITSAVPCADLPPILMVLDASVVLWSQAGERNVPLDSFFVGPRKTVLKAGELLTAVVVPEPPARFGSAYERFALREGNAIAVASVAASLLLGEDDTIRDARIVLGAVAPVPKRVDAASSALIGQPAGDEAFKAAAALAMEAADPICDIRGSTDFRRTLVGVLTRRALTTAHRRAREREVVR